MRVAVAEALPMISQPDIDAVIDATLANLSVYELVEPHS